MLGADGVSTAATITDSQGTAVATTAKDMSEVDSFFTNAGYIGALKEGESSEWADFVAASALARAGRPSANDTGLSVSCWSDDPPVRIAAIAAADNS